MEKIMEWKEYLLSKKKIIILIRGIVVLIILSTMILINQKEERIDSEDELIFEEEKIIIEDEISYATVDIKGEINKPGIYEINNNSRVQDVINLAGGTTNKADTTVINLSKKVFDEMVIIIYSKDQIKKYEEIKEIEANKIDACPNITEIINDACVENDKILTQNDNNEKLGDQQLIEIEPLPDQIIDLEDEITNLISLNNATLEELMTLPGIGKTKAEKIITYREENGLFQTIEDLKNVSGIGDSTFEKLKQYITL